MSSNIDNNQNQGNEELNDLATHAAGATNLHKTRTTSKTKTVQPPVVPNPGPYDTRTGQYNPVE
jgi:hypothetical protein